MGPATCMKAGLGAAAVALGPIKVGAVVSVNACGNVVDPSPASGSPVCAKPPPIATRLSTWNSQPLPPLGSMQMPLDRTNTTISCIVTNVELTKAQATKVSQMAADAYAPPSVPRTPPTTATPSTPSPAANWAPRQAPPFPRPCWACSQ